MEINIFVLKGDLNGKIVVVRFFFRWVYYRTVKRLLIPILQIRVRNGKLLFVISQPKHMLWVLKWTY